MRLLLGAALLLSSGCMSAYVKTVGGDIDQSFSRIFVTDPDIAWEAALDALKSYRLDVSNRESGSIQTRWTDNTVERNSVESPDGTRMYLKTQFRYRVEVVDGFFNGVHAVRVVVRKEQLVQRDALEEFRPTTSDSIQENTLLYRIGRIIWIKMKVAQVEKRKRDKALETPL